MHLRREPGSILLAITIAIVGFVLLGWLVADACFEDESEVRKDGDDLGQPALVLDRQASTEAAQRWTSHGDRDKGRNSRGDCEGSRECSDDDLSPSFENSPVVICLPSSTCNIERGANASRAGANSRRLLGVDWGPRQSWVRGNSDPGREVASAPVGVHDLPRQDPQGTRDRSPLSEPSLHQPSSPRSSHQSREPSAAVAVEPEHLQDALPQGSPVQRGKLAGQQQGSSGMSSVREGALPRLWAAEEQVPEEVPAVSWHLTPREAPAPSQGGVAPASLLPPNPARLVESITAMSRSIGDAAGALAGAIAGGVVGILL